MKWIRVANPKKIGIKSFAVLSYANLVKAEKDPNPNGG